MASPLLSKLTALPSGLRVLALREAACPIASATATTTPSSPRRIQRRQYATNENPQASPQSSVNQTEVSHFNTLASSWWDPHGSSRLLHLMNPLRHQFIRQCLYPEAHDSEKKYRYLDIGCGGGIFAESAARLPTTASVTAIDPTPEVFAVAKRHQRTDPLLMETNKETGEPRLQYLNTSIEGLAEHSKSDKQYDVISLFEVIEHIQQPSPFLTATLQHLKPGGWLIGSTIARTNTSWFTTKFVAEEVLKMVPRGTHDWNQYIQPSEMRSWARSQPELTASEGYGFNVMGVMYVPGLGWKEVKGSEDWGNYFFAMRKKD